MILIAFSQHINLACREGAMLMNRKSKVKEGEFI